MNDRGDTGVASIRILRWPNPRSPLPHDPSRAKSRSSAASRRISPISASAVDLQIELLQLQRRVQSRVSLPAITLDDDYLNGLLASAPILEFEQIPIDWGDLRFLVRATAEAMRKHEALDEADFRRVEMLCARCRAPAPAALRSGTSGGPGRRHDRSPRMRPASNRCSCRRCGRS